jgi:protein TonB
MAVTTTSYSTDLALSHDRLGFAFCVALALHAAIILGVSFNREDKSLAATKLEITLAQHRSQTAPDEADYLAQSNQEGSGTLDEKAMLTTRNPTDYQDTTIREVNPQQQLSSSQPQTSSKSLITTISDSDFKSPQLHKDAQQEQQAEETTDNLTIMQRSLEIASLEAKLDIQRQAYAKRPRVRRLTSVATRESDDALYLHNWRTKIEAIGNQHYPAKARERNLNGNLRLVVSLLPNGDVHKVEILESSGYSVLDQAAIRIVHLAAPYDPFPSAMSSKVDILEIIRTWQFQRNRLTSTNQ